MQCSHATEHVSSATGQPRAAPLLFSGAFVHCGILCTCFTLAQLLSQLCRLLSCFWTSWLEPTLLRTIILPLQVRPMNIGCTVRSMHRSWHSYSCSTAFCLLHTCCTVKTCQKAYHLVHVCFGYGDLEAKSLRHYLAAGCCRSKLKALHRKGGPWAWTISHLGM